MSSHGGEHLLFTSRGFGDGGNLLLGGYDTAAAYAARLYETEDLFADFICRFPNRGARSQTDRSRSACGRLEVALDATTTFRSAALKLRFAQEGYDSIDHFVIEDPTWFRDKEVKVRTESNVGRGFHERLAKNGATGPHQLVDLGPMLSLVLAARNGDPDGIVTTLLKHFPIDI
jgi:hypothetical protein